MDSSTASSSFVKNRISETSSSSSYRKEMTKHIISKFAANTTIHVLPRVIKGKSYLARFFWCFIFLVGVSMFCYQLTEILVHYLAYPKRINVESLDNQVPFPDITLCNMRNLDLYALKKIFDIFDRKNSVMVVDKGAQNYSFVKYLSKYLRLQFGGTTAIQPAIVEELFTRASLSASFEEDFLSGVGVQKDEFIVMCSLGGRSCNIARDFALFQHAYYMNCFTYQFPSRGTGSRYFPAASEGMLSGWSTVVLTGGLAAFNITYTDSRTIPGLHERRFADSGSEGVRVVIHPPNTTAFPLTEGYDVPPHTSASLGIRARQNKRIGPPHGRCTSENPFDATQPYRRISCQKLCLQSHVIAECGCYDIMLPRPAPMSAQILPCQHGVDFPDRCIQRRLNDACMSALMGQYNRIICARNTTTRVTHDDAAMAACSCLPPCTELLYDVSYSLSKWPSEGLEGNMVWHDIFIRERFMERFEDGEGDADEKSTAYKTYFSFENWNVSKKDFTRINVYLADNILVLSEEVPEYRLPQVIADIGAHLGMWVGMSVITVSEVFELIYHLLLYLCPRRRRLSRDVGTYV